VKPGHIHQTRPTTPYAHHAGAGSGSHVQRRRNGERDLTRWVVVDVGARSAAAPPSSVPARAAEALGFAAYNFVRQSIALEGQTPAMAAGLTDHPWTIGELMDAALAAEPCEPARPVRLALPPERAGKATGAAPRETAPREAPAPEVESAQPVRRARRDQGR
jgi:hypothetical protein